MGRTVNRFRQENDYDNYSDRGTKQKRREKIELKRFKNYNPEDYMREYDSEQTRNKKFRKSY